MTPIEAPQRLEDKTIQPIPPSERHGSARDLFTIWFGSNIMVLTVVTGALGTAVFNLPFWWTVAGILVGNLLGAVLMALHSAQGPRLGVPQMVQSRGQFGSYGALLITALVVLMYIGFFASNLVLAGQSLVAAGLPVGTSTGIVVVGVVAVIATVFGYDLIHAYTRVLTYLSGAALVLAFVWIVAVHGLPENFASHGSPSVTGFMGTVTAAALWQVAYAPYVSDYSRYMPADTGARPAFWSSYAGSSLGSILPMILGAIVGVAAGEGVVAGLDQLTGAVGPVIILIFSLGIAATNSMNLYCGVLSTLTVGQTFAPAWSPGRITRAVTATVLFVLSLVAALAGQDNFMEYWLNFITLLMTVLVPWTAINLVDYYLLRHGDYDVDSFFRADGGVYGRVNVPAVACYVIGALVQLPFVATTLYTGPAATAMGGVDLSWIVGLVVISPLYYFWAKASMRRSVPMVAVASASTDAALT
ncbi:cytosine permease [Streptomyces shenzhenensis]|uniref:Cytosine permease n=1 Tax=Streptomyces shenzhenensis TaxID=943815 RepID=A0A3M0I9L4_9ACTN|nr:cytosine permease [Streptomyces shenzhenensis]RMB85042.1 cytosine permease [Streptomyces shenzhenensis]